MGEEGRDEEYKEVRRRVGFGVECGTEGECVAARQEGTRGRRHGGSIQRGCQRLQV